MTSHFNRRNDKMKTKEDHIVDTNKKVETQLAEVEDQLPDFPF